MKTRILTICFLLLSIIGVRAENVVSLSSASGHPGDEVTLQVGLTTTDAVTAAEVIIPLDKQLTYVEGSTALNEERADGHQLSAAVVDGALRIYVYSISLKPLKGTEGTLATFRLKLKKEPADYSLIPQVVLSDATGKELQASTQVGCVTLLSPKLTIVNTRIDYGHIPIRSTYTRTLNLQNSGTEPLEVTDVAFSAAEFSVNEKVFTIQPGENKYLTISYAPTVRGAIEETVTITSNAINGMQKVTLVADPFSVNELHVVGASGNSDTEVEIALRVNNMEPLVGAQCTFTLPEALEYVEGSFATVERSSSHTATSSFTNGKLTVILYSSFNTTFDGNDGVIGTFRLKLDGKSGTYSLKPESVVLSNIEMENMTSATQGAGVIIQSPTLSSNASLSMGSTAVTTPLTTNYTVRNSGRAPLVIDKVTFLTEGFSLKTELPLTIEKSKSATLEVEYTPTKEGDFSTTMNIYTNDPENRMKAVAVSGTVYEPNSLTLDGENQEDGTYQWTVGLNNYTDIVAVQMDIHWLKEMTTSMEALVKTARLNNHSCTVADMGNGVYRVIVYSMNNATITGNDGALFTLTYTPQEGTVYQNSKVQIKNIVLSNKGGSNYESESSITTDAKFTGFTLKFILEGTILSERFVRVGTPITLPEVAEKEGYTFSGWGEVPATMPAQDLTFTASYIINKYKLIYLVDSVDYKTTEVEYGSAITAETAPTKEGHTFSGWSEIPATMPAKDITVTGTFTVNSYKVTYILDGETFKTEQVFYGTAIPIPEAPGKEGYTFCGWGEIPETMPADDVRLEGTFSVNSYNLVYMVDGVNFNKTSVEYGSVITALEVPTKEGYTFSGWSEIPETMPAKDVTIEGTFSVNSYDLVYMVDGVEYNKTSVEFASTITVLEVPTKEGHTFSGWSEIPETMPAKDVMIEGTFSVNSYNLVYMVDGIEYKKVTLDYASAITAEAEPTKEGHTFSGWSEIPATMPAKDVVITGTFAANKYAVIYTFDGEAFRTDSVAYGTAIVLAEAPVKKGYTFAGWSEVPAAMPANDVIVTGTYTINQYTLTYMVDGIEYKKVTLNYASTITAEAEPTKEGHTFSGWSEIPATMPAKDVTVVGEFGVNCYQVTYMLDGKVLKIERIVYDTAIPIPEAPAKEGHTFAGWSEVPAAMPAKDVTVTGTYTVNQYTLTYLVDGIEYKKVTLDYASAITAEAEPTKEGHTFSGWSEIPATMPAKDVTVMGEFGVNSYQVTYMLDGKVFKTEQVKYGSPVPTPEVPAKPGYNFSGWGDVPATMPAKDLTLMGIYTINKDNKYNVIYMVDGVEFKRVQYAFEDAIVPETEPTKEGYTFSGWSEIPARMPLHDVTVVGEFTVNMYQITYMVDGEVYATEQIAYGSAIILKDAPVKEGYIFSGWSEAPETMPAADVVIEGSFTVDGIDAVVTGNLVDVYTLQGVMVKRQIPVETLAQELPGGIYIVNGKKMVIR